MSILTPVENTWLICGLGNPGKEYESTRHNLGFMVIDAFSRGQGASFENKWNAQVGITKISEHRIILLKPQSYMNNSGIPVRDVMTFYKLTPSNLLVVHDELDIGLGLMKLAFNGGSGGHNGVKSIINSLNSKEFFRLKLGIGKPQDKSLTEKWVLSPFEQNELKIVERVIEKAREGILIFITKGAQAAMQFLNTKDLGTNLES